MPKLTKWEQKFWDAWVAGGITGNDLMPHFVVELEIDDEVVSRTFDFGSRHRRVLVEIDGLGGRTMGSHQTPQGMRANAKKRNAATLDDWLVLHYPSSAIDSRIGMCRAVDDVNRALVLPT